MRKICLEQYDAELVDAWCGCKTKDEFCKCLKKINDDTEIILYNKDDLESTDERRE